MITPWLLDGSHPNCSFVSLDAGGSVVAIVPVRSSILFLLMARMICFLVRIPPFYLFHGDRVVAPLDGGHGDRPGPIAVSAAGGGEDDLLLSGDSLFLLLTPQLSLHWS